MKAGLWVAACLVLPWVATPAGAHRLDEFLQATTIAVTNDQVTVQVGLTPGVAVVRSVLADLDSDGTEVLSEAKQKAYAERVLRELSLTVDGKRLPLQLTAWTFSSIEEMKEGVGEILLRYQADVPPGGAERRLIFQNHYQSAIAAYLVNCLSPSDPTIHVIAQNRNFDQSFYQLDYTQGQAAPNAPPTVAKVNGPPRDAAPNGESLFMAYFYHGVHHILTGYDHLLFVSALVLAATTLWELVKVVSAFTLAHTMSGRWAATSPRRRNWRRRHARPVFTWPSRRRTRSNPAAQRPKTLIAAGAGGRVLRARLYSGTIAFRSKIGQADASSKRPATARRS